MKNDDSKRCREIGEEENNESDERGPGRLPNVELERLETASNGGAPGAFPARSLLAHQDVDTGLAETADALGTGVRLPQHRDSLAGGAVDLGVLGRVARRRVRQAPRFDVEIVSAFTALDRRERFRGFGIVRRRCEGPLERGSLVVCEGVLGKGREG